MKRVVAACLALALVGLVVALPGDDARAQISLSGGSPAVACNASKAISTGSSGATELVALSSGATVYVCSYVVVAAGTVSVKFIYGTGSACATGSTDITGAMDFVANSGASEGSGYGTLFKTAVSNALCINLSGAVNVRGVVSYAQF